MITILSALVSVLSFRFRSRASLELELVALRHQLTVLRRQSPRRLPASFRRSAPVGVPLPSVAAGPWRLGTRQTGDGDQMASPRLSDLLAVAITLSRTPQDERRNPGPDPSDESRQSALGRPSHPRRTAQARHRRQPSYCRQAPPSAP